MPAAPAASPSQQPATGSAQLPPITVAWSVTPNPDSLRFYSLQLSFLPPNTSLDFPSEAHAYKSPLAQALFAVEGVASVYFADEYVTVTKQNGAEWDEVTPLVRAAIVEFAHSGHNILTEEAERELDKVHADTEPQPGDDEVVLAIKELLHTRIRPMLAGDGGGLQYVAFEEGLVYLVLTGACRTCPSSGNTLKNGIERMLCHFVPEVAEVVEVDDLWAEDYRRQFAEAKEHDQKQREREAAAGGGGAAAAAPVPEGKTATEAASQQ